MAATIYIVSSLSLFCVGTTASTTNGPPFGVLGVVSHHPSDGIMTRHTAIRMRRTSGWQPPIYVRNDQRITDGDGTEKGRSLLVLSCGPPQRDILRRMTRIRGGDASMTSATTSTMTKNNEAILLQSNVPYMTLGVLRLTEEHHFINNKEEDHTSSTMSTIDDDDHTNEESWYDCVAAPTNVARLICLSSTSSSSDGPAKKRPLLELYKDETNPEDASLSSSSLGVVAETMGLVAQVVVVHVSASSWSPKLLERLLKGMYRRNQTMFGGVAPVIPHLMLLLVHNHDDDDDDDDVSYHSATHMDDDTKGTNASPEPPLLAMREWVTRMQGQNQGVLQLHLISTTSSSNNNHNNNNHRDRITSLLQTTLTQMMSSNNRNHQNDIPLHLFSSWVQRIENTLVSSSSSTSFSSIPPWTLFNPELPLTTEIDDTISSGDATTIQDSVPGEPHSVRETTKKEFSPETVLTETTESTGNSVVVAVREEETYMKQKDERIHEKGMMKETAMTETTETEAIVSRVVQEGEEERNSMETEQKESILSSVVQKEEEIINMEEKGEHMNEKDMILETTVTEMTEAITSDVVQEKGKGTNSRMETDETIIHNEGTPEIVITETTTETVMEMKQHETISVAPSTSTIKEEIKEHVDVVEEEYAEKYHEIDTMIVNDDVLLLNNDKEDIFWEEILQVEEKETISITDLAVKEEEIEKEKDKPEDNNSEDVEMEEEEDVSISILLLMEEVRQDVWDRAQDKFKALSYEQEQVLLNTNNDIQVPLLHFGSEANDILMEASSTFDTLLETVGSSDTSMSWRIQEVKKEALQQIVGPLGLLPLYEQQLDCLREQYGRMFEAVLNAKEDDEIGDKDGDIDTAKERQLAAARSAEGFQAAAQMAVPSLLLELGLDGSKYDYFAILQGLLKDMMEATSLRDELDRNVASLNDDNDDEYDDIDDDDHDEEGVSQRKKQGGPAKWYTKLAARAVVFGVNYLQGWLALQGLRKAAAERDRTMPKFPLF